MLQCELRFLSSPLPTPLISLLCSKKSLSLLLWSTRTHKPNLFFFFFNSYSMTVNIMLCLFVVCLFLNSHPLALTSVVIIVIQFSVELGRFHESRFHHFHLLHLQLLLHAVKLRLDVIQLEGDVCRFLLNAKPFRFWRVARGRTCRSLRSFSRRSLSDVSVSSSCDADSLVLLSSASSANKSAIWTKRQAS